MTFVSVFQMIYVFPRMTKCTFHKFGTSGNIEKHDALCILPLNIVNEKIYIFIWFWLLFLGILSFLILVYRLAIVFSPYIRAFVLRMRYRRVKRECIEMVSPNKWIRLSRVYLFSIILNCLFAGDWQKLCWWLVSHIPAWPEHRQCHIQRRYTRTGQKARLQKPRDRRNLTYEWGFHHWRLRRPWKERDEWSWYEWNWNFALGI